MNESKYLVDVPVAIVFFARPDLLKITFKIVKKLRPSTLFLIQDGPRYNNSNDNDKIEGCREVVKEIDWNCKVYKNYSDTNLGCGLRIKSGISWAFKYVDRLIIIEDDCVPGDSFFLFCKEMLEKYKDDKRVSMISGMNHLGVYEKTPYDYFFSEGGTIWGWATWKRFWETIDYEMKWLDDPDAVRLIRNKYGNRPIRRGLVKKDALMQGNKLSSWSYQHGINMYLQSGLILVPKYNLTTNIGLTGEGANTKNSSLNDVPPKMRRIYYQQTYVLNPPYNHPHYIINDVEYQSEIKKIMNSKHSFCKRLILRIKRVFIVIKNQYTK